VNTKTFLFSLFTHCKHSIFVIFGLELLISRFFVKLASKNSILHLATLALCLFVLQSKAWGQSAAETLQKSATFFEQAGTLAFDFQVKIQYEITEEQAEYTGDLLLGDQDKFRLRIPGSHLYSDGISLWQYNLEQKQVLVKSLLDLDGKLHPSEILFQYLKCKPLQVKKDKLEGKTVFVLDLEPAGKLAGINTMQVWLHEKSFAPVRIKTIDVSNNISWYTISEIKTKVAAKEADFMFTAPAGVETLDMR
jgi:outer membrane lipoprotein-sorting protein